MDYQILVYSGNPYMTITTYGKYNRFIAAPTDINYSQTAESLNIIQQSESLLELDRVFLQRLAKDKLRTCPGS
ncbi:MAG: hypothetical protein K0R57_2686 [Paenibacillaceae bacterium]|jgi:hypothetical protein|nr:hypothetical protein [Paenibacillaceae bacterium]